MSTSQKDDSEPVDNLAETGQRLYDGCLKTLLEHERYFLGPKGFAALRAGRKGLPDKLFYLLRIGHIAAYRMGGACEARPAS